MIPTRYIIGSEPLQSWEEKHPDAKWIVLSGDISCDMYEQLCLDLDYTKYNRISFEALTFGNKIYENEYQMTKESVFKVLTENLHTSET